MLKYCKWRLLPFTISSHSTLLRSSEISEVATMGSSSVVCKILLITVTIAAVLFSTGTWCLSFPLLMSIMQTIFHVKFSYWANANCTVCVRRGSAEEGMRTRTAMLLLPRLWPLVQGPWLPQGRQLLQFRPHQSFVTSRARRSPARSVWDLLLLCVMKCRSSKTSY